MQRVQIAAGKVQGVRIGRTVKRDRHGEQRVGGDGRGIDDVVAGSIVDGYGGIDPVPTGVALHVHRVVAEAREEDDRRVGAQRVEVEDFVAAAAVHLDGPRPGVGEFEVGRAGQRVDPNVFNGGI